ncbi:MAG: proline dehydrogenase family protein [Conexivisphaerales archaeon]
MSIESLLAGKWLAGPSINDAIKRISLVNSNGCRAIVNYLGEDLTNRNYIDKTVERYIQLIDAISANSQKSDISVKVTQIGLSISEEMAIANYYKIVDYAGKKGVFIWLDMESSNTVSSTIKIYESRLKNGNTGIAIQSYLKRSLNDVIRLTEQGGVIRLVKGAYKESPEIAFTRWEDKTRNFRNIMNYLFEKSPAFTIATHDLDIIRDAINLSRKYNSHVTFAMLLEIKNRYAYELARSGFRCSIYIPYGTKWVDYTFRRLREASNLHLILRSILER